MKKNQLGTSDLYVSEVALGAMSLGTNQHKAQETINHALDKGINYIDTADLYDQGKNEEIIGKALKGKRDKVVLATKVGNHLKQDGTWFWDPSKAYIKGQVKESLRRLATDYIDLYQLHGGTLEDPIDETIEAFEELKQEGVIRYYGISSIRPNVIREYIKRSSIVSVMTQYSILDRRPEESILDLLHEHNISVVARGPMAKGILTTKAKEIMNRKGKDGYLGYSYEELHVVIDQLLNIVPNRLNTIAIQYILHHPAVASAVFGASNTEQIDNNLAYLKDVERLSDSLYRQIQAITKPLVYDKHR